MPKKAPWPKWTIPPFPRMMLRLRAKSPMMSISRAKIVPYSPRKKGATAMTGNRASHQ